MTAQNPVPEIGDPVLVRYLHRGRREVAIGMLGVELDADGHAVAAVVETDGGAVSIRRRDIESIEHDWDPETEEPGR